MDSKDFFDKEYDKIESKQSAEKDAYFQNWSNKTPQQSTQTQSNKRIYIAVICVALALCLALGWTLGAIFTSGFQSSEQRLLNEVFKVLEKDYYKEIDDPKMWAAIEAAGTALMQSAGDRYSRLMSPSTYYNLFSPTSSIGSDSKGVFGMSFQIVEGIGLYVSEITVNSNSYGVLQAEDMIVRMSDINDGAGATVDDVTYTDIALNSLSSDLIQQILAKVNSANFHILRDGAVITKYLQRGVLTYPNDNYPFEFVEFYFDDDNTNVSLGHGATGAQTSTKEIRLLEKLSQIPGTGYIRIDQFMDSDTVYGKTYAYEEFKIAMDLFKESGLKRLVLDLKGNPGGSVKTVCDIAGMLITDSKLTPAQQAKLRNRDGKLLVTTLESRSKGNTSEYVAPSYNDYFGEATDKPVIVVWTDGGSASASELLTGALTDYGTAVHMGTTTYGKGIAQRAEPLTAYSGTFEVNGETITKNWYVYYTFAEYFSPVTHTNIHGLGYTPENKYNRLDTYEKLWDATIDYFKTASSGNGGQLAAA